MAKIHRVSASGVQAIATSFHPSLRPSIVLGIEKGMTGLAKGYERPAFGPYRPLPWEPLASARRQIADLKSSMVGETERAIAIWDELDGRRVAAYDCETHFQVTGYDPNVDSDDYNRPNPQGLRGASMLVWDYLCDRGLDPELRRWASEDRGGMEIVARWNIARRVRLRCLFNAAYLQTPAWFSGLRSKHKGLGTSQGTLNSLDVEEQEFAEAA